MEKESKKINSKPIIGITIGDLNGIGTEVIIKALDNNKILNQVTPVIYGSSKVISYYKKALDNNNFNFNQISKLEDIRHKKVNVLNCWDDMVDINPGEVSANGGKYAFIALEQATRDVTSGHLDAIVTAPINKHNIQSDDFNFPGHTEYLTDIVGKNDSLMFMVSNSLRIGVVTGHIALKDVASSTTTEKIQSKLDLMIKSLKKDFGIVKPKIAVLGLNPHAGEKGLLGSEEEEVIIPLIENYKSKGQIVLGPFPADGFFGAGQHHKFDGVLAMYHDQGLIPFKALTFESGVNFTAGLPIVRTSPDHGTAFAIAGKDQASGNSMRQAIYLAMDIANQRREYQD
ncbi:4-hydroxythreonine-4-phosphate dehydrogenase PdxA [Reichenbachiella sp. MALMAid0571]|uniref:4-hydroxythreonine-4-phosphate dehydrogenase PdxA n=1 Tax=Reichenbachiella sp. MALMAid0571 TaxID=3143939 RepID=UPI0032DEEB45